MSTNRSKPTQSIGKGASAYPGPVRVLIEQFATLPGIGVRSAERLAFHVLKGDTEAAMELSNAIAAVKKSVRHCTVCYNLCDSDICPICADPTRDRSRVLVVEQPKDADAGRSGPSAAKDKIEVDEVDSPRPVCK